MDNLDGVLFRVSISSYPAGKIRTVIPDLEAILLVIIGMMNTGCPFAVLLRGIS